MHCLDLSAANVINTVAGIGLEIKQDRGKVDMCKAIEDLKAESRAEGREEGRVEGREEGREERSYKRPCGNYRADGSYVEKYEDTERNDIIRIAENIFA